MRLFDVDGDRRTRDGPSVTSVRPTGHRVLTTAVSASAVCDAWTITAPGNAAEFYIITPFYARLRLAYNYINMFVHRPSVHLSTISPCTFRFLEIIIVHNKRFFFI